MPKKNPPLLIIFSFILLTAVFTFPLALEMNSYIAGFHSTDESYAALWNFWWLKYAFRNHLPYSNCTVIAKPFGINNARSGYPLWNFINTWLSIMTNNVFTYNLEITLSFLASAVFMYYLVYYLTRERLAGILSAVVYSFCPYHFVRTWQHLGLAQIQWMPLYIFTLFRLRDKQDLKNIILSSLSLFLVVSFDYYYAYFMFIVTGAFITFIFINRLNSRFRGISVFNNDFKVIRAIFVVGILSFLLTLPSTFPIFKDRITQPLRKASVYNPFFRPFDDLFSQAAKPLSYLLPATTHPVFGKFTENFIGSQLYGESLTEHTLYLGWVPLILAFMAFRRWRKNRKIQGQSPKSGDSPCYRESFYIGFFILLAIAAWAFSQPPWWDILGFKLYMPTFFLYKIASMFRAYCRFGIVVMLAIAVLAGFGLKFILEKFKSQKTKIAITCLFSGLVLFEFWNWPPFKVIDVSEVPAAYKWLKMQPGDFTIAEYPLDVNGANVMYMFYQTVHEKKIINGTIPETYANKVARAIARLSEPNTAATLKWMGVKYIIVHRDDYLKSELIKEIEELKKIPQNPGLKFIRSFPSQECPREDMVCVQKTGLIDVYEVVAEPIKLEGN